MPKWGFSSAKSAAREHVEIDIAQHTATALHKHQRFRGSQNCSRSRFNTRTIELLAELVPPLRRPTVDIERNRFVSLVGIDDLLPKRLDFAVLPLARRDPIPRSRFGDPKSVEFGRLEHGRIDDYVWLERGKVD